MAELKLSAAGRRYGYVRDTPDYRDLSIAAMRLTTSILPPSVDLEPWCGPVRDQGMLGSCTGNAGAGMRDFLYRRYLATEQHPDFPADKAIFSPLYIYYREREKSKWGEDTYPDDAGAQMRTICRVLRYYGTCPEALDPYNVADFNRPPTPEQTAQAYNYHAGAYHRLSTVNDMRSCLASGYVFVLGFAVYESFESSEIASTYIMPVPDVNRERLLGGHAVLCIGYDDSTQMLKIRNSWGLGWGRSGNFFMPYAVAADPNLVWDCWIQHLGSAW